MYLQLFTHEQSGAKKNTHTQTYFKYNIAKV